MPMIQWAPIQEQGPGSPCHAIQLDSSCEQLEGQLAVPLLDTSGTKLDDVD